MRFRSARVARSSVFAHPPDRPAVETLPQDDIVKRTAAMTPGLPSRARRMQGARVRRVNVRCKVDGAATEETTFPGTERFDGFRNHRAVILACASDVDEAARASITKARATIKTLQAPFKQTRVIGLLASEVKSKGKLTLVRPDRLRWDLVPARRRHLLDRSRGLGHEEQGRRHQDWQGVGQQVRSRSGRPHDHARRRHEEAEEALRADRRRGRTTSSSSRRSPKRRP